MKDPKKLYKKIQKTAHKAWSAMTLPSASDKRTKNKKKT